MEDRKMTDDEITLKDVLLLESEADRPGMALRWDLVRIAATLADDDITKGTCRLIGALMIERERWKEDGGVTSLNLKDRPRAAVLDAVLLDLFRILRIDPSETMRQDFKDLLDSLAARTVPERLLQVRERCHGLLDELETLGEQLPPETHHLLDNAIKGVTSTDQFAAICLAREVQ
jgi:hypothetical protein